MLGEFVAVGIWIGSTQASPWSRKPGRRFEAAAEHRRVVDATFQEAARTDDLEHGEMAGFVRGKHLKPVRRSGRCSMEPGTEID